MNRIQQKLAILQEKKEKAFIVYMTAGLPDLETSKKLIHAQEKAGLDILELGVPFSDPVADGPVIQDASYRAIQNGVNLKKVLQLVQEVRQEGSNLPIVFMLYYNTILHYGLESFAQDCIKAGVDGMIVPDLPKEEQGELSLCLEKENSPILIQLISPVSKERIPDILDGAKGFVYCVSSMGVTGQEGGFHKQLKEYIRNVKKVSKIPVMIGFGIKTAKDVEAVKEDIDGAIVGSYFIKQMEESSYNLDTVASYIKSFKEELGKK